MQKRNLSIRVATTASYTATSAWADIAPATGPALKITVPEDGDYDIKAMMTSNITTNTRTTYTRLAINLNPIGGTQTGAFHTSGGNSYFPLTMAVDNIALKAGDIVSAQAIYGTGSGAIPYTSGTLEPSLTIIKRGL
jgi:hypothetical protein